MRSATIATLILVAAVGATACSSEEDRAADQAAATRVVEQFGTRLAHVSLLAPPDELRDRIRDTYGPYVTTLQLGAWLADPSTAPGRETSSPWPARIEIRAAERLGSTAFDVTGEVLYITAVDGEPILREPITARVVRGPDDVWRIAEWSEG